MATIANNTDARLQYSSSTSAHLRWSLLPSVELLAAGLLALPFDHVLAQKVQSAPCPGTLRDYLQFAEMFGHGLGVLLMAIAIGVLDPHRRRALPRLMTMAWGAGIAANVIKLTVARTRPRSFDFSTAAWWQSFLDWFPALGADSSQQSFPSAHTATATALAIALTRLYPQGRWLFAWLAVSVAIQRIQCSAHFLSDVLCGAAIGWLFATACLHLPLLSRSFDRLEEFSS